MPSLIARLPQDLWGKVVLELESDAECRAHAPLFSHHVLKRIRFAIMRMCVFVQYRTMCLKLSSRSERRYNNVERTCPA